MDAAPTAKSSLVARANALKAVILRDKYKQAEVEARHAINDQCGPIVHGVGLWPALHRALHMGSVRGMKRVRIEPEGAHYAPTPRDHYVKITRLKLA